MPEGDEKVDISIEQMVAQAAERVEVLKKNRAGLVEKRTQIAAQIKQIDIEVAKAERVAKSLAPRTRTVKAKTPEPAPATTVAAPLTVQPAAPSFQPE